MHTAQRLDYQLSPTTTPKIEDTFHVWVVLLHRQMVQYQFFVFSNNRIQKRTLSVKCFPGERMFIFRSCLSYHPKWVSRTHTLLSTNFGFGCRNRSFVGDCLKTPWEEPQPARFEPPSRTRPPKKAVPRWSHSKKKRANRWTNYIDDQEPKISSGMRKGE
jgi:hypothetical protein